MGKGMVADILSGTRLNVIRRAALVALFADDGLMQALVFKEGLAMDALLQAHAGLPVDLELPARPDMPHQQACLKLERALRSSFELHGYNAFDILVSPRPGQVDDALAPFWSGLQVEFKLGPRQRAHCAGPTPGPLHTEALAPGQACLFTLAIDRFAQAFALEVQGMGHWRIDAPLMAVCQKLRSICKQMPEFGRITHRPGQGIALARDFIDIEALVTHFRIDMDSEAARQMLGQMFFAKCVPLGLMSSLPATRDFHAAGLAEAEAGMPPGVQLRPFRHYFEFVVKEARKLEPLGYE